MRADRPLGVDPTAVAKAVGDAIRMSGVRPVNLRKILRNAKLAKGLNGPQDGWPNYSPAPPGVYQQDRARRADQDANARAYADELRREQQEVTAAMEANGGPLPFDHPLSQPRSDMRYPKSTIFQQDGGRSDAAKVIGDALKRPRNELARYFSARMKKTTDDKVAAEHAETALRAPRYLHLSLENPTGDVLRKVDSPTSLEAIKKALSGRPGKLSKLTGMPPEDSGSDGDDDRGDDGADRAHDSAVADRGNPRANPSQLGPRHSASIRSMRAGPQDADIGPAEASPSRVGAVDASEDATTKAIKAIHSCGPQPMWGG